MGKYKLLSRRELTTLKSSPNEKLVSFYFFPFSFVFSETKQNWIRKEENSEFSWRKMEANANPNWLIPCMHETKTETKLKERGESACECGGPRRTWSARERSYWRGREAARGNTRCHSSKISLELSNSVQFISVLTLPSSLTQEAK